MKVIFYFSATGNTEYTAMKISEKTGDKTVSVAKCMKAGLFDFEISAGERVGFISPVYFWGLPTIVREFLQNVRLKYDDGTYFYFVATYGTATGQAAKQAQDALDKSGIKLSAAFSIKTVDTYVPMFDLTDEKKISETLALAEKETAAVAANVMNRTKGNHMKDTLPCILVSNFYPTYENKRKTKRFFVEGRCVGCGLCEKNCPVSAIKIEDGKPVWVKDKCVLCFSCLHHCPKGAIQYVRKNTHGRYVNPNVK